MSDLDATPPEYQDRKPAADPSAAPPAAMTTQQAEIGAKPRREQPVLQEGSAYPLEQEFSLELPLGYAPPPPPPPSLAVVLHAFHIDLLAEFRAYLDHIPFAADLFVSTDTLSKQQVAEACFRGWSKGAVEVRVVPNRGRDVAPKLVGFATVHDRYEYVLHLHTKRSSHASGLAGWRGYLLDTLVGSPEVVCGIFEAFAQAPRLGMLAPQHIDELRPWIRWGSNLETAETLATRMGFPLPRRAPLDFPSGSMFWARSAALRPLLDLGLSFADFSDEHGQTDGTLAHAIERLYFLVCEQAGFDWMKIAARGELHDQRGVTAVTGPESLKRFLSRRCVRLSALRDERRPVEDHPVITAQPAKPRRVLHVLWRRALGDAIAIKPGTQLTIVLPRQAPEYRRLAESAHVALRKLPPGSVGRVILMPPQNADASDGLRRNLALHAGFAAGTDLVVLLDAPGLMHPDSASALLRMSEAQAGRALLEGAHFPQAVPKPVDDEDFNTPWAGGPVLAIPRAVFEATGGFDEHLGGRFAEMDLSWRARASGFAVRHCPRALFLAPLGKAETGPRAWAQGLRLATKWGDAAAEARFAELLNEAGSPPLGPQPNPVPTDWHRFADFQRDPALIRGNAR